MVACASLPKEWFQITEIHWGEPLARIRLATEYYADATLQAYEVTIQNVDPECDVLGLLGAEEEWTRRVWGSVEGNCLTLTTDDEAQYRIFGSHVLVDAVPLNQGEIESLVKGLGAENEALLAKVGALAGRIEAVRALAIEQRRRVTLKASTHGQDTDAGVLYRQQIAYLDRIISESEA